PEYEIEQTGPDHAKTFTAWAVVAGVRHGGVQGRTKKEAEQGAAQAAFLALTGEKDAGEKEAGEKGAGATEPVGAGSADGSGPRDAAGPTHDARADQCDSVVRSGAGSGDDGRDA